MHVTLRPGGGKWTVLPSPFLVEIPVVVRIVQCPKFQSYLLDLCILFLLETNTGILQKGNGVWGAKYGRK